MGLYLTLLIGWAIRTVVLMVVLWIMIKLQKLDSFFLGLLGSAALGAALDMVPYFGHYLAVPVLYLCIWKVTQAAYIDAVFTVAVGYALMFAMQVFLLTALLPPIHPLADDNPLKPQRLRVAEPVPSFVEGPDTKHPVKAVRKTADEWLREIVFKGATENGNKSMLLISAAGTNFYQLKLNEMVEVHTAGGACRMRLVNLSENWANVEVNGEVAYLRLH